MNNLMNRHWWKCAITRAVKTICQTAVALIGSGAIGVLDADRVYGYANLNKISGNSHNFNRAS